MNYSPPKAWFYLKKRQGMGAGANVGPGRLALKDLAQQLFSHGENGFLFGNWAELDELFTVNVGPTNVAADSDPVGLALDDHSWGTSTAAAIIAAQTELLVPGSWTMSIAGGTAVATESPAGTLNLTGDGTNAARGDQSFTTVIGRTYRLAFTAGGTIGNVAVGTAQGGTQNLNINSPTTPLYFVATATTTWVRFSKTTAVSITVSAISCKLVPGNHALTATAGQRPLWRSNSGKPYLQCDGTDDRLVSPSIPTANFTLAVAFNATAVSDVAIGGGASTGGKRAFIGTDAGGGIGYGWGDVNTLTNSTASILNANHVAILSGQGTTRVRLWLDGALVFDNSTISTAPDGTGGGVALAGYNNNGTPASFMAGSLFAALALNRLVTEAEVLNITKQFQKACQ